MAIQVTNEDQAILRELGRQKAEIAQLPIQAERQALWTALNGRQKVKPLILIYQEPWHEFESDETLKCRVKDRFLRGIEQGLRVELYKWRNHPGDQIVGPVLRGALAISDTGYGIDEKVDLRKTDPKSGIASRHYHIQIANEEDIAKIKDPVVRHDEAATAERAAVLKEIFDGILRVEMTGPAGVGFAPWDFLVRLTGVEELMNDLVERPEYVNKLISRAVDASLVQLQQYEALGLLSSNNRASIVGQGGYGFTTDLPPADGRMRGVQPREMWGGTMAQIFSGVSPAMHWEFALQHEVRWLERFGLNYYGCCDPLDNKIEILRRIPRLRKFSLSPWANVARAAAQTRGEFVLSIKPNPSLLAYDTWRPAAVREELTELLRQAQGCPVELILKDVSTVRYEPHRLREWAQIAAEVTARHG